MKNCAALIYFLKYGSLAFTFVLLLSCSKKAYQANSSDDWKKQSSLEIEQESKYISKEFTEQNSMSDDPICDASANPGIILTARKPIVSLNKKVTESHPSITSKRPTKINLLKNIAAVKIAKRGKSGINKNVKVGLILLLIGIVITVGIGGLAWLGSIVAVIGVVFLILGLVEMM